MPLKRKIGTGRVGGWTEPGTQPEQSPYSEGRGSAHRREGNYEDHVQHCKRQVPDAARYTSRPWVAEYRSQGLERRLEEESKSVTKPQLPSAKVKRRRLSEWPSKEGLRMDSGEAAGSDEETAEVVFHLGEFSELARRPGYGTLGKRIELTANYFLLNYKDICVYHYDVDVIFKKQRRKDQHLLPAVTAHNLLRKSDAVGTVKTPAQPRVKKAVGKERCRQVIAELIRSKELKKYNPVYDSQKNIYTAKPFPIKEKSSFALNIEEDGHVAEFEVVIQPVKKVGGGNVIRLKPQSNNEQCKDVPQEVLMVFYTIMCHRDPPLMQVQVGRSFYMLNQRPYKLKEGMEIWFGYNQSVRPTERGTAAVVNLSAKPFYQPGSVIQYASDLLRQDVLKMTNWNSCDIRCLEKPLKKVKIQVTHQRYRRKYTISGVTDKAARDISITVDGVETTVAEYFEQKYRPLKYPYLPCLSVRANSATYIPMEVCEICPNQPVLGKLSPATTSKMIRQTAIAPEERFRRIQGEAQKINDVSGETMNGFGLFMDIRFMQLKGRVLPAPSLTYGEGRDPVAKPDPTGKWRIDGKRFLRSLDGCSWMIISFAQERFCGMQVLERFADTLCQTARKLGMNLEEARDIRVIGRNVNTYSALKFAKEMGVTFAVVVLSSRDPTHSYREVKFTGDTQLQLVTQCMREAVVVKKFTPEVATYVLLKINSKVGGVNHSILQRHIVFSRPVIIIGAHVVRFSGGSVPPIAAVVGSLDAHPFRYAVVCRMQLCSEEKMQSLEIITELENMMFSNSSRVFQNFLKNTRGKYPEKIVFFRSGVSESNFRAVLEQEIVKAKKACQAVLNGIIPHLTYVVVQKRHQTRFRPTNPKDGVGRMGNIPPGTTVDTDVVHPVNFDFFLCSHEGIQGTSKPAHYTVIYDGNGFSADELQKLCFHLCHTYARCGKSVSLPAPLMYADMACQRAKQYVEHFVEKDTKTFSGFFPGGERRVPPEVEEAINNMSSFDSGMFFV